MTARDIILKARHVLGDTDSDSFKWSNDRLIDLVNEAVMDIHVSANIKRSTAYIPLVQDTYSYKLPTDVISVKRAGLMDSARLPVKTLDYMDQRSTDWREDVGYPPMYIIKQDTNHDELDIYPIPNKVEYVPYSNGPKEICIQNMENNSTSTDWGYVNDDGLFVIPLSKEGVTYSAGQTILYLLDEEVYDDYIVSPYGVVTSIGILENDKLTLTPVEGLSSDGGITWVDQGVGYVSEIEGAVVGVSDPEHTLKVSYTSMPKEINDLDAIIDLSTIWATALKYYVVGYALKDDNDANNVNKGDQFISRYLGELKKAKKLRSLDDTTDKDSRITTYDGVGRIK